MILIWSGYDTNIHVASNAFALMGAGLPPVVIRHSVDQLLQFVMYAIYRNKWEGWNFCRP